MKKNLLKGIRLFTYLIILLVSTFMFNKIFSYGKNLFYEHKIEKTLEEKINDEKYSFLYFDNDISEETKKVYKEYLEEVNFLVDELEKSSTEIYVSNKPVLDSLYELSNSTRFKLSNNAIASYVADLNLIVINNGYNPMENNILVDKKTVPANVLERFKSNNIKIIGDYYYLDLSNDLPRILSDKELKSLKKIYNKKTFYHELGHFMDYNSSINLTKNKEFKSIFIKEKDILFGEFDTYYKENIREYIGECVSFILADGSFKKAVNIDALETENYIKSLIDSFK